jgi:lactoylglutathione lyase
MTIRRIHHVAYRCRDAKETVDWYGKYLDMAFVLAIAENEVPSTKAPDPYMHVFLDAGGGNVLAFFELPNSPPMGRDPNTPEWVQHIAFEVDSLDSLLAAKARLEADGIAVLGPVEHTIFRSIYFFDPNGHRLELAVNTATPEMKRRLDEVKHAMLDEWAATRKAPQHARWMHDGSMTNAGKPE